MKRPLSDVDGRSLSPQVQALIWLAAEIAIEAPAKRNKWAVSATVPWRTVEEIRTALTEFGIPYSTLRANMDAAVKQQRKEQA